MILDIQTAREALRIDGTDNDSVIIPLIEAIPPYIEELTGYRPKVTTGEEFSPVARTAARFILQLWYYGENADTAKIERVINSLLKALSAERAFLINDSV